MKKILSPLFRAESATCGTGTRSRTGFVRLWILLVGLSAASLSHAATLTVTNTNDTGPGSLRERISVAVAGDIIQFSPSLIAGGSATILLSSQITIAAPITINGLVNGNDTLFISGGNATRIFFINYSGETATSKTVMNNLALINGKAPTGSSTSNRGGAIYCIIGHLDLNACILRSHSAERGGAIYMAGNSNHNNYNYDLTVTRSSLYDNTGSRGGAIFVESGYYLYTQLSVYINYSSIYRNTAVFGSGVWVDASLNTGSDPGSVGATLYVNQSTVCNNTCTGSITGALQVTSTYNSGTSGNSATARVYITNTTLVNNAPYGVYCNGYTNSYIYGKSSIFLASPTWRANTINNITSLGNNIFTVTAASLNLTPLSFNGGPTKTMMPQVPSIAIDNGSSDLVAAQNGPIIGVRDVGAAEQLSSYTTHTVSSCGPYTWINGVTYTTSNNTAKDTLVNYLGHDSIITLNLTVKHPTASTLNQTVCGSYTLNGQTYTTSGTYTQTRPNAQGCDSTITLNLTIKQNTSSTITQAACGSYTLNGQTYTTSGTYTQTRPNAQGCDSTITLNLTIKQNTTSTLTQTACGSYTLNGQTYNTSGTYTQTRPNAQGCDSTITLNLTIKQNTSSTITQTACGSYTLNGQTYTTSGTYTQVRPNAQGCDSTITLNLTIKQNTNSSLTQTACGSYTLNGQTYTTSGTYTQTRPNAQGCDSTITLNLTIKQNTSSTLTQTACGSYTLNGQTYTTSGTYTQVRPNAQGCDSTITLNLTVKQPTAATVAHTSCGSYTLNGQTYIASGTYTQTLVNAQGCDSTLTLNLTVKQPTASTLTQTACGSYTLNGQTYNTSGTYTQTLTNAQGCDSTITLHLTLNNVNATVTAAGTVLTATQTGAAYQWLDCSNANAPITGATAQTFTATVNGSYAVTVTANGCTATSNCVTVFGIGIDESAAASPVNIYPNPTSDYVNIDPGTAPSATMELTDMNGRTLMVRQLTGTTIVDVSMLPSGIYYIRILTNTTKTITKLVKGN